LYDIVGNLGQWCEDVYVAPPAKGAKGPPLPQNLRTFRGGFWDLGPEACRSASRLWCVPGGRNFYIGFRVVVSGSGGN
jgi:formylglycine-generating enzyme required for sulfatase activity